MKATLVNNAPPDDKITFSPCCAGCAEWWSDHPATLTPRQGLLTLDLIAGRCSRTLAVRDDAPGQQPRRECHPTFRDRNENWLFIDQPDGGQRSVLIYSLAVSCQRHGKNALAYLQDVLKRLLAITCQDDLTPLTPAR